MRITNNYAETLFVEFYDSEDRQFASPSVRFEIGSGKSSNDVATPFYKTCIGARAVDFDPQDPWRVKPDEHFPPDAHVVIDAYCRLIHVPPEETSAPPIARPPSVQREILKGSGERPEAPVLGSQFDRPAVKENRLPDWRSLHPTSEYAIGCGIADITDYATGCGLQGFSDDTQKSTRVETALYARVFIVHDPTVPNSAIAIVVGDMWTGTIAVKREVMNRLAASELANIYRYDNVIICGTHTHSGPGGYLEDHLYNYSIGGFDAHVFESMVSGIVRAIKRAHANLTPGRIYIANGAVPDCGRNRSAPAYMRNPQTERAAYPSDTDKDMILLKFVEVRNGQEFPVGALNWYAVHPTCRGQTSTSVTGDSKGWASMMFESEIQSHPNRDKFFVAAFANSNCGDVSGNVEYGDWPRGGPNDKARMEDQGNRQYQAARTLFYSATARISGPLDARHTFLDLPKATGRIGSVGLSMFAGSTEDGDPASGLREGITSGDGTTLLNPSQWLEPIPAGAIMGIFNAIASPIAGIRGRPEIAIPTGIAAGAEELQGHFPKPIVIMTGAARPHPITPNIVPLQILRIGTFAILGLPGEITTMAGRRLQNALRAELLGEGITTLAICAYANGYCQYITTPEEYGAQHYEGASTLFGPGMLEVFQTTYADMARTMLRGAGSTIGPPPPDIIQSIPHRRRITIRNLSNVTRFAHFYAQGNTGPGIAATKIAVPAFGDASYTLPDAWPGANVNCPVREELGIFGDLAQASGIGRPKVYVPLGQLLTISADGIMSVGPYTPRAEVRDDVPGNAQLPSYDQAEVDFLAWATGAVGGAVDDVVRTIFPPSVMAPLTITNATPFPIEIAAFDAADILHAGVAFLSFAVRGSVHTVPANSSHSWVPPNDRQFKIAVDQKHELLGAAGSALVFNTEDWFTVNNNTPARVSVAFYREFDPILGDVSRPFPNSPYFVEPNASFSWKAPIGIERFRVKVSGRIPFDAVRNGVANLTPNDNVRVQNLGQNRINVRFYIPTNDGLGITWDLVSHSVNQGDVLSWTIPDNFQSAKIRINNHPGIVTNIGEMLVYNLDGTISRE